MADGQMGIHAREKRVVLGLDPGRDKTGFAFVDEDGGLLASGIFPTNEQERFFEKILAGYDGLAESRIIFVAVGDGTHSKEFTERVRAALPYEIMTVDERNSTLEARSLYWKVHTPSIWVRLLPEGMRVPGGAIDDMAAWAIALRGLKKYRDIRRNRL
ncbi:MAG: endonuclease [Synergistaceae bacterium]|nr:endonuclease [Synergistaceae bacterium]